MNLNNITLKTQEVLQNAQLLAQEYQHQQIEPEHLFKALLETDKDVTPYLFKKLQINKDIFGKNIVIGMGAGSISGWMKNLKFNLK